MEFGKRELPIQVRNEEKVVATVTYIYTLNTPAEFTCYIYSAKVTRLHYRRIKPALSAC